MWECLTLQLKQLRLRTAHARLRPPVLRHQIIAFEQAYKVAVPADFATYLACFDGFDQDEGYQDEAGFNFWPLSGICPLAEYEAGKYRFPGDEKYFLFCDYLDFSWAYAVSFEHAGIVMVGTANGEPMPVADSYAEFLSMYLRDDAGLYPPLVNEV